MHLFVSSIPLFSLILLQKASFIMSLAVVDEEQQRLKVVYAGFGRTGTHSLGHALQQLGYNPIHGETICRQTAFDGEQTPIADAIIRHDFDTMIHVTERLGFNATLDIHGMFWKEIMQRRPDAKYIFMIRRDKEKWKRSMKELDWFFGPIHRYPMRFFKGVDKVNTFLLTMGAFMQGLPRAQDCFQGTAVEVDARFDAAFDRFHTDMLQALQEHPNNTMLFDMEDGGYPALCQFLNVSQADCPQGPFPRLGTKWEFRYRGFMLRLNEAFVAGVPLLCLYKLVKLVFGLCSNNNNIKPKTP